MKRVARGTPRALFCARLIYRSNLSRTWNGRRMREGGKRLRAPLKEVNRPVRASAFSTAGSKYSETRHPHPLFEATSDIALVQFNLPDLPVSAHQV
ncbi:hypothetical protein NDU88_004785 [Pleurodeles waltl]|uniref:Uncharacterized protein n=1 Tax=Pleurodeles waltl TaxID=8319 RepID=A0AAV7TAL7_PLEWA|nr:hypothetical protein NDU88_004785 [Pleurodeles waltl]